MKNYNLQYPEVSEDGKSIILPNNRRIQGKSLEDFFGFFGQANFKKFSEFKFLTNKDFGGEVLTNNRFTPLLAAVDKNVEFYEGIYHVTADNYYIEPKFLLVNLSNQDYLALVYENKISMAKQDKDNNKYIFLDKITVPSEDDFILEFSSNIAKEFYFSDFIHGIQKSDELSKLFSNIKNINGSIYIYNAGRILDWKFSPDNKIYKAYKSLIKLNSKFEDLFDYKNSKINIDKDDKIYAVDEPITLTSIGYPALKVLGFPNDTKLARDTVDEERTFFNILVDILYVLKNEKYEDFDMEKIRSNLNTIKGITKEVHLNYFAKGILNTIYYKEKYDKNLLKLDKEYIEENNIYEELDNMMEQLKKETYGENKFPNYVLIGNYVLGYKRVLDVGMFQFKIDSNNKMNIAKYFDNEFKLIKFVYNNYDVPILKEIIKNSHEYFDNKLPKC